MSSGVSSASSGFLGTGKTSLGQSIARALDRPFQRIVLDGVRDEASIRSAARCSRSGTKCSLQGPLVSRLRFLIGMTWKVHYRNLPIELS